MLFTCAAEIIIWERMLSLLAESTGMSVDVYESSTIKSTLYDLSLGLCCVQIGGEVDMLYADCWFVSELTVRFYLHRSKNFLRLLFVHQVWYSLFFYCVYIFLNCSASCTAP